MGPITISSATVEIHSKGSNVNEPTPSETVLVKIKYPKDFKGVKHLVDGSIHEFATVSAEIIVNSKIGFICDAAGNAIKVETKAVADTGTDEDLDKGNK